MLDNSDGNYPDVDAGTGVTNYAGNLFQNVNQTSNFIASANQSPTFANRDRGNYVHIVGITPTAGAITVSVNYDGPADFLGSQNGDGIGVCGLQLVNAAVDLVQVSLIGPVSQRVMTNTPATFSVAALGNPAPVYQWYRVSGGVTNLVPGATNSFYTTPPVQDSDTGTGYFVVAANSLNSVTSTTAILTAGHVVSPAPGVLENDEFNTGGFSSALTALTSIYPGSPWLTTNTPGPIEFLASFKDHADLSDNSAERIYGWFTPAVTTNYVFFVASDDAGVLWLSTNNSPSNVFEIAQNQGWMTCGNDGPTDWTLSNTGTGEEPHRSSGEWRSDQFELNGGPAAIAGVIFGSWSAWPGLNVDGSIPLTGGARYYIELDHQQGGGGQGAAVTYKFAGAPDPATGSAPLLAGNNLSTISAPDYVLSKPQPRITKTSASGSSLTISGTNGLVNAQYYVLSSTNVALPLVNWTITATQRFDASGNFSYTTSVIPSVPRKFYRIAVP
jgi:hypothetical protein